MDATTNVVRSSSQPADVQNTKVINQPQAVKSDDKNAQKDNNDFRSILGKAQDKDKNDKGKAQDKTAVAVKGKDDKQIPSTDVKSEAVLTGQVIAMINVASLPNMQIIAEATVPETLAMPGVNGVTAKNANFSKILMATNSKTSAQTSLTGTLEQLLPQNDVGKTTTNQAMLDLLNGKTAGTISPNGIVDKKQLNTLLQTGANIAQKSLDIPATNDAVVQTEIKAPTGTAMIANAAKAAVNFVSGQNDSKVGIVSSNLQTVSVKTNKQTKGTNLLDVNQPVNMTVEDRSHVKSNTVIDAQLLDTAKPIVEKPVEIAKPIDAAIIDTVKPTEKNILNLSNTPLSAMKANPNEHDVQSPTQFSQLMVNSLHSASGNAEPAVPVETTQQLAKYDIPGQIVEQARLIKTNEDTQMIIKLNPEHLGDLTLKVSIANGGAVTASFHSDNAQVRTMLESSMIQLKQELEAKGMKVDNVEVYAGLSDFMSNGQHNQANSQQQKSSLKNQRIDLADFADTVEKVNSSEGNISEDRVDYRI